MSRLLGTLVVGLGCAALPSLAYAQPSGDTVGHFPYAQAGIVGAFSIAPIPYATLSGAPDSHDDFGGLVGPQVEIHVDARAFLLNVEGTYNLVGGGVGWMGRAQVVLGKGLGLRTKHHVVKSISDSKPDYAGNYTRTTEWYTHKHVPMFIGVSAAASVWQIAEASYTAPSYTEPNGVTNTREAAVMPMIDAGFTMISPQLELTLAPLLDLSTGSFGIHWAYGMALPIGDHPFYFRFTGDHIVGDDPMDNSGRRMSATLMCAIGFGTGLGVGL